MFEKLGHRKYAIPFVAPFLIICLFALMFFPMANMQMKDVPVAVVNLDSAVELPDGDKVNVGSEIAEALESGEGLSFAKGEDEGEAADSEASDSDVTGVSDDALSWTVITDEATFEEAKANNEYFAYLVIPEGFTLTQVAGKISDQMDALTASNANTAAMMANPAAAVAMAEKAQAMQKILDDAEDVGDVTLSVQIDKAKSPMAANQLKSVFSLVMAKAGFDADVVMVNDGGYDDSDSSAFANMMVLQLSLLPAVIGSLIAAILLSRIFNRRNTETKRECAQALGKQIGMSVVSSLIVAATAWAAVWVVAGLQMPAATTIPFLWLASFCMILLLGGFFNLSLPLGVLVAVCILGFGNMTGVLPAQMLPEFWAQWVCPWAPQAYMGEGIRMITYMGAGIFNSATPAMLVYGAIGLVLYALSWVAGSFAKSSKEEQRAS
ncbi:MAG: ABC transporter permease [Eggerthellaceae bacterium]